MTNTRWRHALAFTFALVLASCSAVAAKGAGEGAVAHFHDQLDAGSFDQIYDEADDQFKAAASRDQFTKVVRAIHDKLGKIASSKQTGFFAEDRAGTNAGSYIRMTYDTQFATGRGTETFDWRVTGGSVRLVAYNINSADLITR